MRQWTHDELHALIDNNPNLKATYDRVHALPRSNSKGRERGKLQMMEIYAEATGCKKAEVAKEFVCKVFAFGKPDEKKFSAMLYELVEECASQKLCHSPLGNDYVCFCDEEQAT